MKRMIVIIGLVLLVAAAPANAIHFYRGDCDGNGTDDGRSGVIDNTGNQPAAFVSLMHNTFNQMSAGMLPVTMVNAGDTVEWGWASEHCHSITADDGSFDSGFVYPSQEPSTPAAVPGLFHYPVPNLFGPTLYFQHTFDTPGTYTYYCVHHRAIGMVGAVVVQ